MVADVKPIEQRYEYRGRFDRAEDEVPVVVGMETLGGLRQALSVGWGVEARQVGRWEPFDLNHIPGLIRLRQPDSTTVHAGVLIDGWRLESAGETYSTFCGPKSGGDRLLETSDEVSCKRCLAANESPAAPTGVRTLIAWHAREIARLTRLAMIEES